MSDINEYVVAPSKKFAKDCMFLITRCSKPDSKGKLRTAHVKFGGINTYYLGIS